MNDVVRIIGAIVFAFVGAFLLLKFLPLSDKLIGFDRGREFADDNKVNKGKPTGVGFYFVIVFALVILIFSPFYAKLLAVVIFTLASMMFGFLDDRSKNPWNPYLKGGLDFLVAILAGIVFADSEFYFAIAGTQFFMSPVLYAILGIILIIVSINATNSTDGVDGLSGSLTILTILTLMAVAGIRGLLTVSLAVQGLAFVAVLAAYLIFNHYPCKVLMGDAGSRALGFFIAYYAMALKIPFAYLIVGLPFLCDGGISVLKITVGRLTKKKIILFKNIRTPLHSHLKDIKGFSVPKTWATICAGGAIIDILFIIVVAIASNI